MSHRPQFRQDLIAELVDDTGDSGARFIDVMDPQSGNVFRFFEVEYSLACAMDGERDVPGIVQWAKEELGLSPTTSEVQSVIDALRGLGYLEPVAAAAPVEVASSAESASSTAPVAKPVQPSKPTAPAQPARPVEPARPVDVVHASAAVEHARSVERPSATSTARSEIEHDRSATIPDLELGHASAQVSYADTAMSAAADIELGSGIMAPTRTRDTGMPMADDIALGQPGRADVGDLSNQVGVSVADVKEAVRASQMMPAVDPEAASIELPASRPSERPKTHPTRPQPAPRVARTSDRPKQPDADVPPEATRGEQPAPPPQYAEPQPAAMLARDRAPTAVERFPERAVDSSSEPSPEAAPPSRPSRPDVSRASRQVPAVHQPVHVAERSGARQDADAPRFPVDAPTQPRVSRTALALLALLLVAGVGYVAYKVALKKPESQPASTAVVPAPSVARPPEPPPVEVRQLDTTAEETESIKPPTANSIESIQEGVVKRGEVIVRFIGRKRIDIEISALQRDLEKRLQPELAAAQRDRQAAQAAGNAAKLAEAEKRLADRQKSVSDRQAKLAAKKAEVEKYLFRAPADGKVVAKAAAGAKVSPTDEIAQLIHAPLRTVTFKNASGEPKTRVLLVSHASGRKLPCVVAKVDAAGTTIECPLDVAPAGAEVTFGGIDTSPPDAGEIQLEPPAAGSAAVDNAPSPSGDSSAKPAASPPASTPHSAADPKAAATPGSATPAGSGESPEPSAAPGDKPAAPPADKPGAPSDKPSVAPTDPAAPAAGSGSAQ